MANEIKITVTADDRASRTLKGVQATATKMGDAIRKATLVGGAAIVGLSAVSLKFASDLDESMNKVNVVFGDSADAVVKFSENAATALGISQARALEATGTFGNLFVTMGLGQEDAASMSTELAQLAADLASFNNIDPTEALDKLRAGLVGEVEPLRTVGVALNAAAVEAEAMRLGLVAAGDEMSEADKVQARYSLILQQTTTAQGDFARTSDGMANGMRIARAQLEDLAAKMGTMLMPIALKVLPLVLGKLDDLSGWFEAHRPEIEAALEAIASTFVWWANTFKRGLEVVMPPLMAFAQFIYDNKPLMIAAIMAIAAAVAVAFGPVGIAAVSIASIITQIGYMRDNWRDVAIAILNAVQAASDGVTDFANGVIDKMGDVIEMGIKPFIAAWNKLPNVGGIGDVEMPQIFEGGGLERSTFAPDLIARLEAGRSPSFEKGSGLGQELIDAAGNVQKSLGGVAESLAGTGGGGAGGQKSLKTALDEAAEAQNRLLEALTDIQDEFMHEQIQSYLQGGQSLVDAVKDSQKEMFREASIVAHDLMDVFGIDLPEALKIGMETVREATEKAVQAELDLAEARNAASRSAVGFLQGMDVGAGTSPEVFTELFNNLETAFGAAEGIPSFATGGIVPGPRGAPVLARVHGGETVVPAGAGGGVTINVYAGVGDPVEIGREVARVLNVASSMDGPMLSGGMVQS